ncbi:hypothetical protein [Bacillus cereus]|uniref:hypothetical protein n=1 Tax=Bacillus cereus TaxID=1396 RepID=UPI0020D26677|nr:hypothetical protein [Bacillus cereus]
MLHSKLDHFDKLCCINIHTQRILCRNLLNGIYFQNAVCTPTNTELYVTNSGSNTVSVIDLNSNTEITRITVGPNPTSSTLISTLHQNHHPSLK